MTTPANSYNNQFIGFTKGSIPVTNSSGYILQQKVPADGMVLVADSTQTTGWNFVTPDTAAQPTVTMSAVFGTPYVVTATGGTYALTFNAGSGMVTYSRNNAIYFVNARPVITPSSISSTGQTAVNGFSYDVSNSSSTTFNINLSYVATNSGEMGTYSERCELFSSNTGLFSLAPTDFPIQFGNQVVPVGGHLISNQIGDSISLRMNNAKNKWFATSSIGTFTISTT